MFMFLSFSFFLAAVAANTSVNSTLALWDKTSPPLDVVSSRKAAVKRANGGGSVFDRFWPNYSDDKLVTLPPPPVARNAMEAAILKRLGSVKMTHSQSFKTKSKEKFEASKRDFATKRVKRERILQKEEIQLMAERIENEKRLAQVLPGTPERGLLALFRQRKLERAPDRRCTKNGVQLGDLFKSFSAGNAQGWICNTFFPSQDSVDENGVLIDPTKRLADLGK